MYLRNCFFFFRPRPKDGFSSPTLTMMIGSYKICTAIEGTMVHVFRKLFCFSFRPCPRDVSFHPTLTTMIGYYIICPSIEGTCIYGTVFFFRPHPGDGFFYPTRTLMPDRFL